MDQDKSKLIPAIILLFFGMWFLAEIPLVPFHPDESTNLFLSSEWNTYIHDPLSMTYDPRVKNNVLQHYRLIDPPIKHLWIGFFRSMTNQEPLTIDWDWSKTWVENYTAGALPSDPLLFIGRFSMSILVLPGLWLFYLTARKIGTNLFATIAMILLAINPILILHTRRAMAEGALFFLISLAMWSWVNRPAYMLNAFGTGLAFCAKYSAIGLFPTSFVSLFFNNDGRLTLKNQAERIMWYLLITLVIVFILHPVAWSDPISTFRAALQERNTLTRQQNEALGAVRPDLKMDSTSQKAAALIAHLFYTPPALSDLGNYLLDTRGEDAAYLANPANNLARGPIWGTLVLILTITGFLLAGFTAIRLWRGQQRVDTLILLMGTVFQFTASLVLMPQPFQRYVIPLLPFMAIWQAFIIARVIQGLSNLVKLAFGKRGDSYTEPLPH